SKKSDVAHHQQRKGRVGSDIVNEILYQTVEGIPAFSVGAGVVMHGDIDDAVGGHHQQVVDLGQMGAGLHDGVHNKTPHKPKAGDLQIGILTQHLGGGPDRQTGSRPPDDIVLAAFVSGKNDVHVRTFVHHRDHLWQFLRRVLQVVVHGDD